MIIIVFLMLAGVAGDLNRLTKQVADSGRAVDAILPPGERVTPQPQIAPGAPPLLSFRYYEGQQRHRYADTELMLDDAGH